VEVPAGRFADGGQLWLEMLVNAMQDASRPECQALPFAGSALTQLHAQLARPAPHYPPGSAAFSRCN
jgi:hypothetical protein